MRIYERLSQVYNIGWGGFALRYLPLIAGLLDKRRIGQARILDLACGTGILALELAHRGHMVCGVDISPHMIAIARSKAAASSNVSFEVQDMSCFHVEGAFNLVLCTYDSINYLHDAGGVRAMFHAVYAILAERGLFVFDSNTDRLYLKMGNGSQRRQLGDQTLLQEWSYDPKTREATISFEFSDGFIEIHRQHPYDLTELRPLLADAGLGIINTFSKPDGTKFTPSSDRLVCVCERLPITK